MDVKISKADLAEIRKEVIRQVVKEVLGMIDRNSVGAEVKNKVAATIKGQVVGDVTARIDMDKLSADAAATINKRLQAQLTAKLKKGIIVSFAGIDA